MPRLPGDGWRWQSESGWLWLSFRTSIYTWHFEAGGLSVGYLRKRYRKGKKS